VTALGLIETKGFLAAIEGADAMLKAANVRLLEKNLAGGGLVTISISGEVAAVKASVDAAVASIRRIAGAALVSAHVIARPDAELARIIAMRAAPTPTTPPGSSQATVVESSEAAPVRKARPRSSKTAARVSGAARHDASQLKKLSAKGLRQIAGALAGFPMTPGEMASASKKDLIEAIIAASRQEGE
jgi:microcompartment protein CcmL/EutN